MALMVSGYQTAQGVTLAAAYLKVIESHTFLQPTPTGTGPVKRISFQVFRDAAARTGHLPPFADTPSVLVENPGASSALAEMPMLYEQLAAALNVTNTLV